jgi:hypothetical protein
MGNLNKVISLHQASKMSGYHQDYLSFLIRKNEIEGRKMGGNWFTTEEEIKNYIFKQQTRHKNLIVKWFLYFKKANKSFLYSLIILALFSAGIYFFNEKYSETQAQISSTKVSNINNTEIKEAPKELKF